MFKAYLQGFRKPNVSYNIKLSLGLKNVNTVLFLQEAKERKKRKEMGWDDEYLVNKEIITDVLFIV